MHHEGRKFQVIETTYGSVDEEMDDDRYTFDHVYADHFQTYEEAVEYASEMNLTRSHGGRYSYRASVKVASGRR